LLGRIKDSILDLMRGHRSPRDIALALAIGVWIGVSPLWGLHTILAVALSVLFRLNTPAVLLGTMISNPWLAPLIILVSLEVGVFLTRNDATLLSLEQIRRFLSSPSWDTAYREILLPYIVGSLLLSTAAALLTFWIALRVAQSLAASSSKPD
jgi:uncharacterized protein (DUF2062 family)